MMSGLGFVLFYVSRSDGMPQVNQFRHVDVARSNAKEYYFGSGIVNATPTETLFVWLANARHGSDL